MAQDHELIVGFVPGGMNSALDPALLDNTQYEYGVNLWLDRQLPKQRPGARVRMLVGEPEVLEALATLNIQGAKVHNPARGQGTQIFGQNLARIIVAAGGRKFSLEPTGSGVYSAFLVNEITTVEPSAPDVHLAWMESAENYLISTDGVGSSWIFDGQLGRYSIGFHPQDQAQGPDDPPTNSEIPAGSRAPVYAHGRLWVVVNNREILAGDIIHGANQTSPEDLLKFTEQGYWAEGQYFSPPSGMGDVIASAILPVSDTTTGQGDILFHCVDGGGVFAIDGNVFPRTTWSDTPMVKHVLLGTAATGPYALDTHDQDQVFRSRHGIETLRSARAEATEVGKPNRPISEEVTRWLGTDHPPFLRFASLVLWRAEERLLCTTQPVVEGTHRYHRGLVAANLDALDSRRTARAWESLWTFPPEIANVIQLIHGLFGDEEKVFAIHRGDDGRNRFVEYDPTALRDTLEDTSESEIECQLCSRTRVETGNHLLPRVLSTGEAHFSEISSKVHCEIFHAGDSDNWRLWGEGEIVINDQCPLAVACAPAVDCCPPEPATPSLGLAPGRGRILLGKPNYPAEARRHRFLLRWRGPAKLEGLMAFFDQGTVAQAAEEEPTPPVNAPYYCFNDYSYGQRN